MNTPEDAFFSDLIAAVEQQLSAPGTRYVKQTYERLVKDGASEDDAKEIIAQCLAEETDAMFRAHRPFDEKSYRTRLATSTASC